MDIQKEAKLSYGGPVWGAIFTVVWVICVGSLFAILLGAFQVRDNNLQEMQMAATSLIWPFVALALGVPIIVFVWFGGYEAISRLADLRKHLDKIGEYTADFDRMGETAATLKSHMEGASESVAKASNSINSNFEEFETKISPKIDTLISGLKVQLPTAANGDQPNRYMQISKPVSSGFDELHTISNDIFYWILASRNAAPGKGRNQIVVSRGGWDKSAIVKKLQEEGRINEEIADALARVFELGVSSRRWGRDKVDSAEISALHSRLEKAWEEYRRT